MPIHADPTLHEPDPTAKVERIPSRRVEEAIGALLGAGPSAAERFVRQAASAKVSLELGWAVVDAAGRYRMAVFSIPGPGRASMLLATHPRDTGESRRLGAAVAAACEGSKGTADIVQALIDPAHSHDRDAFLCGGLREIARLDYLERALPRAGTLQAPAIPEGWILEPAAPPDALASESIASLGEARIAELAGVLDASYIDTQDCPGLAGLRKTTDVLVGHFGSGARPRFWTIAREHGVARGACLVNVSHDGVASELVYLGLSPEARSKGVAHALLMHGLHLASGARCSSMQLAVDERNAAARKLYDRLGFRKTTTRIALVRGLRAAGAASA